MIDKKNKTMKGKIIEFIQNPEQLEQLYRDDRKAFEKGFEEALPDLEESEMSKFWKIRLEYDKRPGLMQQILPADIFVLIGACMLVAFLIKIPEIFTLHLPDEIFYARYAAVIVFAGLAAYMVWANKIFQTGKLVLIAGFMAIPAIYVNLLPATVELDSVNLVYLHLPLLMWFAYGVIFVGFRVREHSRRMDFLRYHGDLAILMAVLVISGGILTAITIGLFEAISIRIEEFYMKNVVVTGAVSLPVVATFIIRNYPSLTSKIAPVVATIFSPLVLMTALIYLAALAFQGKSLYNDREFLLLFNIMLLGVMAVILFSVSGISALPKNKFILSILLTLSIVTVIIDLLALSAIFYRLGAYGITPNRLAVLGSNVLILGNLIWIVLALIKVNFRSAPVQQVEQSIAGYLPVYLAWILFVVFAFPLIFGT